jgi:NADH dehydrogenase/NADH:ubiquinone oxidoreductase subunit G
VEGSWSGTAADALRGLGRTAGVSVPLNVRLSSIGRAGAILILDEDLQISQPIVQLEVHRAVSQGAAAIFASQVGGRPRPEGTTGLGFPPGKAELLFTSLAALAPKELRAALPKGGGTGEFLARLESIVASTAARELALSSRELRELASRLSRSKSPVFLFGPDSADGADGLGGLAALWNLARLVGGRLIPLDRESNTRGGLEIAESFAANPSRGAARPKPAGRPGRRALYVVSPNSALGRGTADLIIVQASFGDETTEAADIVFPEATTFEAEGTLVNVEGRIQVSRPAIAPVGQARPGWWIVKSLAEKLGTPLIGFESAEGARRELASVPALGTIPVAASSRDEAFIVEGAPGPGAFFDPEQVRAWGARRARRIPRDPDDYRGLNMSLETKSLKLVRKKR